MAADIVGRDEELERIGAFLASLKDGPSALTLEGEPGVGKTALWRAGLAAAAERSIRVLAASPAEAEANLSFASLGDLLHEVIDELIAGLPVPQQTALSVALLRQDPKGPPPDQRAIAVAVLNALRTLAEAGPLVLAVDDLQWLDAPSAAVLAFAGRRLGDDAVGLLVTERIPASDAPSFELERTLGRDRCERLVVGPLTIGALHRVIRDRLSVVLSRTVLRRVHDSSGGNPFFALELTRALERRGVPLAPGEALPVPDSLHELVQNRLAQLPADSRRALAAAAALSQPTTALVNSTTGLDRALAAAVEAQIVELDGDRVRFTHPLLASAAYGSLEAAERRKLHGRLASLVRDPEERARHLAAAASVPDATVALALDEAAARARGRGASATAAELAEQALRLTPPRHTDDRLRRMLIAGQHQLVAGDPARARVQFKAAVDLAPAGPRHAEALTHLAYVHRFEADMRLAVDLYRQAIAEAEPDPAILCQAHSGLSNLSMRLLDDLPAGARHAEAAVRAAEESGDVEERATALALLAVMESMLARAGAVDIVKRAVDLAQANAGSVRPPPLAAPGLLMILGSLLTFADDLRAARGCFERAHDLALELGDDSTLPLIFRFWSYAEWLTGDWSEAARLAQDGFEAALQTGQRTHEAVLLGMKALVAGPCGSVAEARRDAQTALTIVEKTDYWFGALACVHAQGLLELSLGHPDAAYESLAPLQARTDAAGLRNPSLLAFIADEIESLVALGRIEEAGSLLDRLEQPAQVLELASALARAARCRGLILSARGDVDGAIAPLEAALHEHERVEMPFEHGRTLLVLGQVLRRAKQKRRARDSLEAARAIFDRLGAVLWAKKAQAELARIGGRAPSVGGLTPTERRVAELVADGCSNKEAAAALFISPLTVEGHLKRIYAKLGIHSRTQLQAGFDRLEAERTNS